MWSAVVVVVAVDPSGEEDVRVTLYFPGGREVDAETIPSESGGESGLSSEGLTTVRVRLPRFRNSAV